MSESASSSSENKYAVLMETNGKEFESWLFYIRYNGNEESLRYLQNQLEKVEFYILDDLSTFDLDLDHLVSEQTAKEMTKVELNSVMFHRKFDGKLEKIDLGFKKGDKNDKKILRCFKKIGIGAIDQFIEGEDIDEEDLTDASSEASSDDSTDYEYGISDSDDDSDKHSIKSNSDSDSSGSESDRTPSPPKKKKEEKLSNREINDRKVRDKIMEMKNRRH